MNNWRLFDGYLYNIQSNGDIMHNVHLSDNTIFSINILIAPSRTKKWIKYHIQTYVNKFPSWTLHWPINRARQIVNKMSQQQLFVLGYHRIKYKSSNKIYLFATADINFSIKLLLYVYKEDIILWLYEGCSINSWKMFIKLFRFTRFYFYLHMIQGNMYLTDIVIFY